MVDTTGFRRSWLGYGLCLVILGVSQAIGIYLFTRGFLLSRPVLDFVSNSTQGPSPAFDRTVILIVDALRFDFTMPGSSDGLYYHDKLPVLYDSFIKYPQNTVLLKFLADPPTTTLQRIKGLTTGSLPTFVDAGSNFAGTEVEEDNWVLQLRNHNKTVAFMGDDTWSALYSSKLDPQLNFPYPSLNVWDLHSVDNGVAEHLIPLLEDPIKPYDLVIGHMLGVDHAGHRYGPNHPAMADKLRQTNDFIGQIMNLIDDKTLFIVMGDHGMDPKGDHGGDSQLELESTLWMYTKKKGQFNRNAPEKEGTYDTSSRGENFRSVNQIDLVPTLSLLLGLPIPYNNLGFPIPEAFPLNQHDIIGKVTADQIEEYRRHILTSSIENTRALDLYSKIRDLSTARIYQKYILNQLQERWVHFDLYKMYIGLSLVSSTVLISLILYGYTMTSSNTVSLLTIAWKSIFVSLTFSIITAFIRPDLILHSTGIGLVLGFVVTGWSNIKQLIGQISNKNWLIYLGILCSHCLLFVSNSFTIWEDRVTNFVLCTAALIHLIHAIGQKPRGRFAIWHSAVILGLLWITSYIRVCREEQSNPKYRCKTTFYMEGSSTSSPYSLLGLGFCTFLFPQIVKAFYALTGSYTGAGPLYIGTGLQFMMIISVIYWGLEAGEGTEFLAEHGTFIRQTKLLIARIALGASLIAWIYSWDRGKPLCIELDVDKVKAKNGNTQASIRGYNNIYGSSYFLLILGIFSSLLIVNKPLADVSLVALMYIILSLLDRVATMTPQQRESDTSIVALLCMTAMSFFFRTGHQVNVPSIQWDVGFIPSENIVFPFTHLAIILNTFGSIILVVMTIPLLIIWQTAPSKAPLKVLNRIFSKLILVNLYYTIMTIVCMGVAAHLRRHLMVWKIFAPRFMFATISLLVIDVVILLALVGSGKIVRRVSELF